MMTDVSAKPLATTIESSDQMVKSYLIIWLNESFVKSDEDSQTKLAQLRSVIKQVKVYKTSAQCFEALHDLHDEKVFVIVSGNFGQDLISNIHDMVCIDSIYMYVDNTTLAEEWVKKWVKIQGIFTSIKSICDSLKNFLPQYNYDSTPMSFLAKTKTKNLTSEYEKLNTLPPLFMYSVLFKEIVLEASEDYEANSMHDLVAHCRQKQVPLKELNDFEENYRNKTPVWWFSSEIFVYHMLNSALRSLDLQIMINMGFFIRHLHKQLEELHEKQSNEFMQKFTVYRGQGLIPQDFQQLTDTKGGLLSFNSFVSTSKLKQVGMSFAYGALNNENNFAVLFIMTIDPSKISTSTTPYAFIDNYSAVPQEQEILFSMNAVFRIEEIQQTAKNKRLWEVQLRFTGDDDPQLATLTNRLREELRGSTEWHRMGKLMQKLGPFQQAEDLYRQLLEKASNENEQAPIYHQIGVIRHQLGEYQEAVTYFERFLEIRRKTLSEDHPTLLHAYSNIAAAYYRMGDYMKALDIYEKTLKTREKILPPNHLNFANSYNSIGNVYNVMGDYSRALDFYKKALDTYEKSLPTNHPSLALACNSIGGVYDAMGDYSQALEYYEKALKIKEKALPPDHPNFASSYNSIGGLYKTMGENEKALEYYERAHEILQKTLPSNHPSLADSYNNISTVYRKMNENAKALERYNKSLNILQKALPAKHPSLATSYNNIAAVHHALRDYPKALVV